MLETWLILSFIPPLIWSIVVFLDKFLLTSFVERQSTFLFYGNLLLIPTLGVLIFVNGFKLLDIEHIFLAIFAGMASMYCFMFYGKSLQIEETTKVMPLLSLLIVFTLIFDIFFLKEDFTPLQIVGIFIILFGALLITSKNLFSIFKIRKVLGLMLLCDLLLASKSITIKYLSNFYDFLSIQSYLTAGGILACLSFFLIKKEREDIINSYKKFSKKTLSIFVLSDLLDTTAFILINFIFTISVVSITIALVNVQYIFIFIFGIILSLFFPTYFKENLSKRELVRKFISIIIILIGIFLITF